MPENTNHRQSFHQSMGEASVLPRDDPQRKEIERRIADSGETAESQWRALLDETDALRATVPDVIATIEPSAEFQQRLLAIANDVTTAERRSGRAIWSITRIAAMILILAMAGIAYYSTQVSSMNTLAVLAINNHVKHVGHAVSVETSDASELERALSEKLPFEVVVPSLGEQYRLVGGRTCKLGTHPVAFSLWESPHGKLSLFQGRADELGLSSNAAPKRIRVRDATVDEQLDTVMIWADETRGYVLVGDPESALESVVPSREGGGP